MASDDFAASSKLTHAYLAAHHAAAKKMLPRDVRARLHAMALPMSGGASAGAIPGGGFPMPGKSVENGPLVQPTPVMMAEDGLQNAMVAHYPPPDVATAIHPGGDLPDDATAQDIDDLHMTVVFCGKLSSDDFDKLRDALAEFSAKESAVPAAISGTGHFLHNPNVAAPMGKAAVTAPGTKVALAMVDSPGLNGIRERLAQHLKDKGVPVVEDHGFTPHISLASVPNASGYLPTVDPDNPPSYSIDSLTATRGDERHTYPLAADVAKSEAEGGDGGAAADVLPAAVSSFDLEADVEWTVPIIKSEKAKQIVTGLVLVPGQEDYQGDIVDAVEIEKTAYDFLAHYNEQGLQHGADARSDVKVVESYIAPETFVMLGDDGKEHTVPKGTWVLSSKLPDDLWADALAGKYAGYSVQGHAVRRPVAV